MSDTLRVAAVQMVSAASVAPNLAAARRLVGEAAGQGARLVALPEFFPLMGRHDTDKVAVREPAGDGPIQRFLAETAREAGVTLVGGTVPLASPDAGRVWNACLVYGPDGGLVARYDKMHLFGFRRAETSFDESATIMPGTQARAFTLAEGGRAWRIGLSVCYDLRFPEYYRALGEVDLTLVPSAFTYATGQVHWEVLLRARAIENLCYVLAPAQGGRHENRRRTWGHSMLVDPWGAILQCLPEGEGVVIGELDAQRVAEVRANLPALSHRVL